MELNEPCQVQMLAKTAGILDQVSGCWVAMAGRGTQQERKKKKGPGIPRGCALWILRGVPSGHRPDSSAADSQLQDVCLASRSGCVLGLQTPLYSCLSRMHAIREAKSEA